MPLKSTRDTLKAHFAGIPWSSLPETFQDAITITRKLGIQYLWIDALCIVQDDLSDWEIESSKMASIYSHSFLTIAASHGRDSRSGCFHQCSEMEGPANCHEIREHNFRERLTDVFIRKPVSHEYFLRNAL